MQNSLGILGVLMACAWLCGAQVTIIDSGSTNRPGMTIKLQETGPDATLERRDGSKQKLTLAKDLCDRLMGDLKAAGPLNEFPAKHCMKSISFGSTLHIEYNGVRSPDLSCPQTDSRLVALKKDANDILSAAKTSNAPAY